MTEIVTIEEFAYAIHLDVAEAEDHELLLELATGLVVDELGELDPWPTSAKAVVLAASARAYYNPTGVSSEGLGDRNQSFPAAQMGVYLTDDEIGRLHNPSGPRATFEFPGTWPYPDPVERTADVVTG